MSFAPINIIAESINDSVPSTHELYEAGNIAGIRELAKIQDEKGGKYIDVNVGGRSADFFAGIIQEVQSATRKPLSIDTPDAALAEAALRVYDDSVGKAVLNSISPLRLEMFALYKIKPFRPILLISEQNTDGNAGACHTDAETFAAAKFLITEARKYGIANEDIIFDPGIAPIGTDSGGNLIRLISTLRMIQADKDFAGVHASVGLSNFTVMLPSKRQDGSLVKGPLESAFLTRAMPLGLDYVIGSVKRNYELLADDHPAMQCIDDCLKLSGYDTIKRVREFYKK
ncbi:MAG: dihydropteroate synthase [Planctomycetaceae bacterium]|jgi:5-methyltetrahydrofolate--homocysteine methyltransferase|nr:dihydropteroate synthase [Planctomycetaceae bacterium]